MPIQQRSRKHTKAMYVLCFVALQARNWPTASAGIGGSKQGSLSCDSVVPAKQVLAYSEFFFTNALEIAINFD